MYIPWLILILVTVVALAWVGGREQRLHAKYLQVLSVVEALLKAQGREGLVWYRQLRDRGERPVLDDALKGEAYRLIGMFEQIAGVALTGLDRNAPTVHHLLSDHSDAAWERVAGALQEIDLIAQQVIDRGDQDQLTTALKEAEQRAERAETELRGQQERQAAAQQRWSDLRDGHTMDFGEGDEGTLAWSRCIERCDDCRDCPQCADHRRELGLWF